MPTMDQVAWASCNITTGGETQPFARGALLPGVAGDDEQAERALLRLIGAIRTVEVVYSAEELAGQAQARAEATAVAAAARDVDPSVPLAGQDAGGAAPGPPTLETPHGGPVVIGPPETEKPKPATPRSSSGGTPSAARSGGPKS